MSTERTQVAIIGAGPAGLLLSHLLHLTGISSVVLERQSSDYVKARIRAGVLEQGSVDVLTKAGVGERLQREGLPHGGFHLGANGTTCRIALDELTGKHVTVYGQSEVTSDLMDARNAADAHIAYKADNVALHDITSDTPRVTFTKDGKQQEITCDFIAGCDGFHGPSRQAIPNEKRNELERVYPFGWLGILADVPPCNEELVYANSDHGFALASMRSAMRSRYYIQCRSDDDVAQWSDERLWDEVKRRLGPDLAANVTTGPAIEKGIAPLRSFVCETMRYGRLFLAGDAAHIVPPTGAKGLNLAIGDVSYLASALDAQYNAGTELGLQRYSETALRRVWKTERFSWLMTALLHDFETRDAFGKKMQRAELDYIFSSRAAQTSIAENYVGLPFENILG